jgi:hypothetical protein
MSTEKSVMLTVWVSMLNTMYQSTAKGQRKSSNVTNGESLFLSFFEYLSLLHMLNFCNILVKTALKMVVCLSCCMVWRFFSNGIEKMKCHLVFSLKWSETFHWVTVTKSLLWVREEWQPSKRVGVATPNTVHAEELSLENWLSYPIMLLELHVKMK